MALLRRLSFIMFFIGLIGCGGGDGGFSTDGGTTPDPGTGDTTDDIVVTLAIEDLNVVTSTNVIATVMKGSEPVKDVRVTFAIDDADYGSFNPEKGTKKTNDEGVANITLNVGESAGTGQIIATLDSGESSEPIYFNSQGTSEVKVRIGSGTPFNEGKAGISLAQISAGGTSVITVSLIDEQGELYSDPVEISFKSVCSGKTEPTALLSNSTEPVSGGIYTSTYTGNGCVGDDPITVNAIVNGESLTANALINVLPADVGSIEFVLAEPEHIAIKGTGSSERPERALVYFRVRDTNGINVSNQDVDFSLSSEGGGIVLEPTFATSDNDGIVRTVVNSGTVARTVSVIAKVRGSDPLIQTQSNELKVSTGVPDQDSMSISADVFNPEAWDIDGTEVNVTIRLADASNNPPPPTAVVFTTEGGSIETLDATCITDNNGACSVVWRSQEPKPEGQELSYSNCYSQDSTVPTLGCAHSTQYLGQKYGGRTTILATAIGEESFPDINGNGRFDECEVPAFTGGTGKPCNTDGTFDLSGEDISYTGNDVGGDPYDLDEAHLEHNEDWIFNPAQSGGMVGGELEEPVDFNINGLFDTKDGMYNGVLCALPEHDGCSEVKSLDVRDSIVIVMSGSNAYFTTISPLSTDGGVPTLVIIGEGSNSAYVVISDLHNQQMPMGSTIEFIATAGSVVDGGGDWPNSAKNGGLITGVTIKGEKEPKQGSLIVKVTTPSGVISLHTVAIIDIQ
ncbi:hypothetical protein tinsulaeT_33340 [Thalassotalea insulae]|uniref:Big-1 domain-containing protein n=1 Tax=Thalassotalea insulae TaxID=2056778 RepID=A0ABQ6GWG3_9GAMM|nr:hypothetical protein [Thalassotalea insulae]GLX79994.1 hypothetical protein tinsulaeT_33340 [Thalassotalea insulae]